jgi:nicotinamidase-related amidase
MNANDKKPALLLIDVQQGFDDPMWGNRNNPGAELRMAKLLQAWRAQSAPVIHVRHLSTSAQSPLRPGQPGCEIKPLVAPVAGESVMSKQVNSCFIGTSLEQELHQRGIETVVLCGLTTDHCVSTSARMAGNLGFTVFIPDDATATHDRIGPGGRVFPAQEVHDTALASLHGEFATVMPTDQIIARVLGATKVAAGE